MRIITSLLIICTFCISKAQSYEITGKDTINLIDANKKKQGIWIVRGADKAGSGYAANQKIEEGSYKDNKRIGVWKEYHKNGNLKSSITYVNGKPEGPTISYYENGKVREEGTWKQNRWVGAYKSFDEAGNGFEITFDEKGKEISKKIVGTPKKK